MPSVPNTTVHADIVILGSAVCDEGSQLHSSTQPFVPFPSPSCNYITSHYHLISFDHVSCVCYVFFVS